MPAATRAVATRTRTHTPKVQIVRVPGNPKKRSSPVRRGYTQAAKAVADEKHTLTAIMASAGLGLAKRQGIALPKIAAIGTAGTYGLGSWIVARMTKSRTMAHVATGLLSVAAFSMAAGDTMTGDDDDDDDW